MEIIPDHLNARFLNRPYLPLKAGKVVLVRLTLYQMPSGTIAGGANAVFKKPNIITFGKFVMAGRVYQIETPPVLIYVSGALKAAHKE